MPGEALTNATVEWIQRFHNSANALDQFRADAKLPVTDDFIYEDRRSGGMNFGRLDASQARAYLASMWDVGRGRPQMSVQEVIAVRGERLAAVIEVIAFGDGAHIDGIVCYGLDSEVRRLHRAVIHDLDDRHAAIVELDRLHAEIAY